MNYLLDAQLLVGLIAGRERSAFSFTDKSDPIRGMSLRWTPTERTTVSMLGERRFFGNGWDGVQSSFAILGYQWVPAQATGDRRVFAGNLSGR